MSVNLKACEGHPLIAYNKIEEFEERDWRILELPPPKSIPKKGVMRMECWQNTAKCQPGGLDFDFDIDAVYDTWCTSKDRMAQQDAMMPWWTRISEWNWYVMHHRDDDSHRDMTHIETWLT